MNNHQEDIDIIDLILLLWKNRLIFVIFIIISTTFGGLYLLPNNKAEDVKNPFYETNVHFTIDNEPPSLLKSQPNTYSKSMVRSDFHNLFDSMEVFSDWKRNNKVSEINFEDFSNIRIVDMSYSLNNEKFFILMPKEQNHVLLRSNKISILEDMFSYLNYVSDRLTYSYISYYEKQKKLIEIKFSEFNKKYSDAPSAEYIFELIKINNFLNSISDDKKFINFGILEEPKNLNKPKPKESYPFHKLIAFVMIGAFLGFLFIYSRNLFINRSK